MLNGDIPVHTLFIQKDVNLLPSWMSNVLNRWIGDVSATSWFGHVKQYYNLGFIGSNPSAQYVKSVYMGNTATFHCSSAWDNKPWNKDGCGLLTGQDLVEIIKTHVRWGKFPSNDNAVYLVALGPDVAESVGGSYRIGQDYCAYHSTFDVNGKWLKYAVTQAPGGTSKCQFITGTQNGATADGMVFFAAHELVETITSPNPYSGDITSAWSDSKGNEVMDKCELAITNIKYVTGADGVSRKYNMDVNGFKYVIPAVWDRVAQT